jgi:transcriptional antiterminator Rof (Rho-off)
MKKTAYKAVDCGFHDQIEAAIVLRTLGSISFLNAEGKEEQREAIKILDWVNKNKEEFVILSDGTDIRMDKLTSFMGKVVVDGSCAS